MKRIIILSLISLIIFSCSSYENKDKYEIEVGETVEIYYSTNSCCYYCLANEENLNHVKLIERKIIDSGPEDCDGCNYIGAFLFKGESIGIDTVEVKYLGARMNCDNNEVVPEKYIIEVK